MRILFIGDITGKPGRRMLAAMLGPLRREFAPDAVIANGENAAGGFGITRDTLREILDTGVDVVTGGNHSWAQREARELHEAEARILRPANWPPAAPGHGSAVVATRAGGRVAVLNLQGRVFSEPLDDPFRTADRDLAALRRETPVIVVDMHAEATSEKVAMGWYLDGRVTAVIGTHTHVQTADERVLPGGTAYITDVGMTGARDGVIGFEREAIIRRFLDGLPARFEVATGPAQLCAVVVDADPDTGRAAAIERIRREHERPGSAGIAATDSE